MIKPIIFKNREKLYMFLVCFGVVFMIAGSFAVRNGIDNRLIAFGSGVGAAGVLLGSVGLIRLRRKPDNARQQQIDQNDERNIKIREKSGYSTYFVTLIGLAAAEITCVALDYIIPCIIIICIMTIHVISFFLFTHYYNKHL